MTKNNEVNRIIRIISELHFQLSMGEHTISACYNKCGSPARGGYTCYTCLTKQLGAIVGDEDAKDYVDCLDKTKQYEDTFQYHVK